MTISPETKISSVPKKDLDGNIYGWETDFVETGNILATVKNASPQEVDALRNTVMPGTKHGIHKALEVLAQIKPIGSSDLRQATVISYLTFDLLEAGASEFVVNELCREYRRNSTNRFFPDHGEFFRKAQAAMKKYEAAYIAATNPKEVVTPKHKPRAPDPEVRQGPNLVMAEKFAEVRKSIPKDGPAKAVPAERTDDQEQIDLRTSLRIALDDLKSRQGRGKDGQGPQA